LSGASAKFRQFPVAQKVTDKCGILSTIKPGELKANDDGDAVGSL